MVRGFVWENVAGWQGNFFPIQVLLIFRRFDCCQILYSCKGLTVNRIVICDHVIDIFAYPNIWIWQPFRDWLYMYNYGFCLGRTEGGRGWGMDRLTLNILTLILPTCPEQNEWTVLGELIVRQTLTPTRDHLLNSPYCTTITGYKLKGEVCLWSAVGA